jgi:hypothetical protein
MMKPCPNCALQVRGDAIRCHHCGTYLSRSLRGIPRPDPGLVVSVPVAGTGEDAARTRMRRFVRSLAALLAILALIVFYWKSERRRTDPAANPLRITFEEFDRAFGAGSEWTPERKDSEFDRYRGQYVQWEGTVLYPNLAELAESHVSIRHRKGGPSSAPDVTLYARPSELDRFGSLRVGDRIRYLACLVDYGRDGGPITVQDGRVAASGREGD